MSNPCDILGLYLHLAYASQRRNQPHVRDRLLVIAGVNSARMNLTHIAAYCRHLILQHNRAHLVRRWPRFEDALQDDDFLCFLKQVQRRYPQEKAERMLSDLGIVIGNERETYYTDEEYAAALLGETPSSIQQTLTQASASRVDD